MPGCSSGQLGGEERRLFSLGEMEDDYRTEYLTYATIDQARYREELDPPTIASGSRLEGKESQHGKDGIASTGYGGRITTS